MYFDTVDWAIAKPQLQKFAMDAWCAPERILLAHPSDQMSYLGIDPRARPNCRISSANTPGTPCDASEQTSRAARSSPHSTLLDSVGGIRRTATFN
jgi:hypothetical protein